MNRIERHPRIVGALLVTLAVAIVAVAGSVVAAPQEPKQKAQIAGGFLPRSSQPDRATVAVRVEAARRIVIPASVDGTTQVCVEHDVSYHEDVTELCLQCFTVDELRGYSYGSIRRYNGTYVTRKPTAEPTAPFIVWDDGSIAPTPGPAKPEAKPPATPKGPGQS